RGKDSEQQQIKPAGFAAETEQGPAYDGNRANDDETNQQPEPPVGHVVLITRSVVIVAAHLDAWSPIPGYRCQPVGPRSSEPVHVTHCWPPHARFAVVLCVGRNTEDPSTPISRGI